MLILLIWCLVPVLIYYLKTSQTNIRGFPKKKIDGIIDNYSQFGNALSLY